MIRALLSTIALVSLTSAALADTDDRTWIALMELSEEQIDQLTAAASAGYAIESYAYETDGRSDKNSSQAGNSNATLP